MRVKLLIVMTIILASQLLGEIKAGGKLLIPTATGEKPYKCVMVITRAEIRLECDKRIFQPFNQFDTPKQAKLKVNTAEIYKIQINGNEILLIAKDPLYQRYRHLFHPIYRVVHFIPLEEEKKEAIIFIMDNPADIYDIGLIEGLIIDDRSPTR
jgi:hypothetical protein